MRSAPSIEDIDLAVAILWVIWTSRNQNCFNQKLLSLDRCVDHIHFVNSELTKHRVKGEEKKERRNLPDQDSSLNNSVHNEETYKWVNTGAFLGNRNFNDASVIMVDSAWRKQDGRGVAAWALSYNLDNRDH